MTKHWSEELKKACARYQYGQCQMRGCLIRGGYGAGDVNYAIATCVEHEAIQFFENTKVTSASKSSTELEDHVSRLNTTLFNLISWMSQAPNSPINYQAAAILLNSLMANGAQKAAEQQIGDTDLIEGCRD